MTLDDQLCALAPLKPGQVAILAGYSNRASVNVQRQRGRVLTPDKLRAVAKNLHDIAERAARMAEESQP